VNVPNSAGSASGSVGRRGLSWPGDWISSATAQSGSVAHRGVTWGVERTLAATRQITVATGIVNIWKDDPATIAASYHRLADAYAGRFLLGVGAGHPEATSRYTKPYDALVQYLDGLDTGGVPQSRRVLAALGPKVLRLAADRTAGAHPYLVTPEHTRRAREWLGTRAARRPRH
jgi:probable F420-dependent oxidoreductase